MALKPLAPARDDWRQVNSLSNQLAAHRSESVAHYHNLMPQLRRREDGRGDWHPFKIYQVFSTPADPQNDWLRFRVRAGRVMESDATGTDGANADPDAEELQAADTSTYITVESGVEKYYFWLDIAEAGVTTAAVRHAADPATVGPGNPVAWSTYPKPDSTHVPIGWVDTLTHQADKVVVIRQLLREDVIAVGKSGVNYKGTYVVDTSYSVGDIVRVRSGEHQGVYICVKACSADDDPQHVPTYPEPADTAGVNYWEILALGIRQMTICTGGTPTTANVNTDAVL